MVGSSPRVRGTGRHRRQHGRAGRFIPACAGNGATVDGMIGPVPVHPRVCGERAEGQVGALVEDGSSPRVRGTVLVTTRWHEDDRFIPACAGNGCPGSGGSSAEPVHPRVCGERRAGPAGLEFVDGSSPRVRGTAADRTGHARPRRFIPACAGNGSFSGPWRRSSAVHPRVCGERLTDAPSRASAFGSSPRVRGTETGAHVPDRVQRFIPACAGNGRRRSGRTVARSVHPRVCGERLKKESLGAAAHGSSPRVRGTVWDCRELVADERFIPACAGNGSRTSAPVRWLAVHPRVCGERVASGGAAGFFTGSSPRVRGTGAEQQRLDRERRFIPACAGNGRQGDRGGLHVSVHPRVCGERARRAGPQRLNLGSSPRVRGTGADLPAVLREERFIPACAGNGVAAASPPRWRSVHPRVCGERTRIGLDHGSIAGSSPRVRGTGRRRRSRRPFSPVHPRVCGERTNCILLMSKSLSGRPWSTAGIGRSGGSPRRSFGSVLRGWGERYELQSVEVTRHPSVDAHGVEVEPLVSRCGPADQAVSVVDAGADLFPNSVANPSRVVAYIDPGADLQEPYRQPAAQAGRCVVNRDDHHRRFVPRQTPAPWLPRVVRDGVAHRR